MLRGSFEMLRLWRLKIPPRVMVFGWLALRGGILTIDNLRRLRNITVNACPLCLAVEETIGHLLLNCKMVQGLWYEFLSWFDCNWAHPSSILGLFEAWCLEVRSDKESVMWRTAFPAISRIIWKERKLRYL